MRIMQKETLRRQRERRLLKWISIGALIVVIVIIMLIFVSQRPMRQARTASINVAKRDENVENVDSFYTSDLNHTFYTIGGTNAKGKKLYVITNQKHRLVRVVPVSHGVSRDYVVSQVINQDHAHKIINVAPSIFVGKTVWIASYENRNRQLCYQTFRYRDGKSIQLITNV